MVEMALEKLSNERIVYFDEQRKANMAGNLLAVLCGAWEAQPVLNTDTIRQ